MITNAENSLPNGPPTRCLVSILPSESIQSLSPGLYAAHRKSTPKRFRDFGYYVIRMVSITHTSVTRTQPITIDY